MDKIFFSNPLPELILKGKKTSTWRINEPVPYRKSNTTHTAPGDIVSLWRNSPNQEFAQAKVTKVVETTFEQMDKQDQEGHEVFASKEEMYTTYSRYYQIVVSGETKIKIIWFELI